MMGTDKITLAKDAHVVVSNLPIERLPSLYSSHN